MATSEEVANLHTELIKIGGKVDNLISSAEADRKFMQALHADHLRLEGRVRQSEDRIQKTQSDLDKHIEIACIIQKETRDEIKGTRFLLQDHMKKEDEERAEIIKHLRDQVTRERRDGKATLMWAVGVGTSVVLALFGLLWATGTIGT